MYSVDDLVWRSIVWAAHKPFVLQGMPHFLAMRVDDVSGPLDWLSIANEYGLKPWAGLFLSNISDVEASELSTIVNNGMATASIHSYDSSQSFYFNNGTASDYPDDVVAAHFAEGTTWHQDKNIPISKFVLAQYYELGTNVFQGLSDWGVEFVGTHMDPGNSYGSPWIMNGPYRLLESGLSHRNKPVFYADFLTIPGHLEFEEQFFNCVTEIRDDAGYEWYPDLNDVDGSIGRGTRQSQRAFDNMALATLFTHGQYIEDAAATNPGAWRAILAGITSNLSGYEPVLVTIDYGCQYVRATRTSHIAAATYDAVSNQIVVTFDGVTDLETKFYVFMDGDESVLFDVPLVNGPTTVTYAVTSSLPVASNDTYTVAEDGVLNVAAPGVLSNDSDPEGGLLSAVLDSGPANGSVTLNADGSFTYTPNANFNGNDSFTYTATNGSTSSSPATVTITVSAVNDVPVAADDSATTTIDTAVNIPVLDNDYDLDGDELTVSNLTQPANGTATVNADNTVAYTPNTGFTGSDNFTYTANDGVANSNVATVTVEVIAQVLHHFEFDTISTPQHVDEPFQITIYARDASGNLVSSYTGIVSISDSTGTVTPTTAGPFSGGTWTESVNISAEGSAVTLTASDGTISGTSNSFAVTALGAGTYTIWGDTVPSSTWRNDTSSVELGVKFRSQVDGYITGLRFWKDVENTGTHVGHLWRADGTLLAEATFTDETASGWQEVTFAQPVPILTNTTYVASYKTTTGYNIAENYFATSGFDSSPLRALADGEDGGNGVYRYGRPLLFPNRTHLSSNYWVDVLFTTN
jgi:VCBS repeat-containing protein